MRQISTQQTEERKPRSAPETSIPCFVYDKNEFRRRAEHLISLEAPFGWLPRYAAKANPHPEIIRVFNETGLHFDASSSFEATELISQGVIASRISLSSQQTAHNLDELLSAGVLYTATSLHQLELFLRSDHRSSTIGLRVNPGLGAGHNNRTTTGGANSSFGLWSTYLPQAIQLAKEHGVKIDRLHIHIGSGADPAMWGVVMDTALDIVTKMPDVISLNIGGGFKVHRYGDEKEADMTSITAVFSQKLISYERITGRGIRLEIEPGTWLIAHSGKLIAEIDDIVDTGPDGHIFLRLNTGMNDIIRPSMYGSQHKIEVLNDNNHKQEYVVVGHNCETGDILTPAPSDPEGLEPRLLNTAKIGDRVVISDTGAYCASFSVNHYNSFPSANEIFVDKFDPELWQA